MALLLTHPGDRVNNKQEGLVTNKSSQLLAEVAPLEAAAQNGHGLVQARLVAGAGAGASNERESSAAPV